MTSVGIFTYSTKPRGSVVHATHLAEAIVRAGHEATVYALGKGDGGFWRPLACQACIFPAAEAPADPGALVRQRIGEFVAGLERSLPRHDVLHAQDCLAASALLALRARRPDGGPAGHVVRTVHHVESFESPYLAECQRRSILEADAVFSVSRMTRREVLEQFGRPSSLVHNGVDERRFRGPRERSRAWLGETFGVGEGDEVVLTIGGVEPRKNVLLALEAFALAHERQPRSHWVLAGTPGLWAHSAYAEAFAARLSRLPPAVRARVTLAGPLAEDVLTALYRASAVVLCTATREGFGLSVLEAMAAGRAVIAPDREPFTEYLGEDRAVLVDVGSAGAAAAALARLLGDPALRARLGSAARLAAAAFSWDRAAATHLALYRSLRSPAGAAPSHAHERHADA